MIPVHNHSEYSALDGYARPEEIADRIVELGLPGAFLTDHGTVAGWMPFAKAMQKHDLFFGLGMEAYQARSSRHERRDPETDTGYKKGQDAFHLVLLAENKAGYANLLRLADESNRSGYHYDPRVDWELLEKYREGIIATSACMGGLVIDGVKRDDLSPLHRLRDIYGDNFFIELHTYDSAEQAELNDHLSGLAYAFGCPLLIANDAHYPSPDEYELHNLLLKMQHQGKYSHPPCLYIMDEADVRERLGYLPQSSVDEAIKNTDWLAERCQLELPSHHTYLPTYPESDGKGPNDLLLDLMIDGLHERYPSPLADDVIDRAETEYFAICDAGLADYFLIVWDYVHWAYRKGIMVGPGRGSVGGSILAYALGITHIDPLRYGLYFERFWNPGRSAGLPDIDIDFEQARRGEVKQYITDKWGENRVLGIGNHIRMGAKSAIDKVAAVIWADLEGEERTDRYRDMKAIKAIIDTTTDAGLQADWEQIMDLVEDELKPWFRKYPDLFVLAAEMTGRLATYGVHASAVVISSVDLPDHLPCMRRIAKDDDGSSSEKVLVSQLEMHGVEDAGFPKFDFLGLRNLDTLMAAALASGEFDDIEGEVARRQAVIDRFRSINYNTLADSYWAQVEKGQTLGLFQIEEGGAARRIGKQLRARTVLDLAAIVALNRPGPLRAKDERGKTTVDRFIARRRGDEPVVFPADLLKDILAETYGDFLYQEQVINYFIEIGYSLGEADDIRKMLGKKLVEKMKAEFPRYMERASKLMPERTAESIWNGIVDFSKYSFNKSHAVGYGMILAWTMYAKWRWPTEFIMASIVTNPSKVGDYIREGARLRVKVIGPDINRSEATIATVGDEILFGLVDIKGVGPDAVQWIIDHRPYEDYLDFQDALLLEQDRWKDADPETRGRSPKQTVRSNVIKALLNAGAFDAIHDRDISESDRLDLEDELLGVALWTDERIDRIIGDAREHLEELDPLTVLDNEDDEYYRVPGIITLVTTTKTRPDARYQPDRNMGFVTLEWKGESVRCAAFPETWDSYRWMFRRGVVGEFTVRTGKRGASLTGGKLVGEPE